MSAKEVIYKYLASMKTLNASDLFIIPGAPLRVKVQGKVKSLNNDKLNVKMCEEYIGALMSSQQTMSFVKSKDANFGISIKDVGRFRASVYTQRNNQAMVIRRIETEIPSIDDLTLPQILKEEVLKNVGISLFVGAANAGKSTTLASLIDYRNENSNSHVLTIEDPIEFIHHHKQCIISQREVGMDCPDYFTALKNSLRQSPDVVVLGEIRTQETMEYAIRYAETGHLVLATLHARNTVQAIDRITRFFPAEKTEQVLHDLATNLNVVVAQRLVPGIEPKSRKLACEVLINTQLMKNLIIKHDMIGMKDIIEKQAETSDMRTFDQCLLKLYEKEDITAEIALSHSDKPNDMRIAMGLLSASIKPANKTYTLEEK